MEDCVGQSGTHFCLVAAQDRLDIHIDVPNVRAAGDLHGLHDYLFELAEFIWSCTGFVQRLRFDPDLAGSFYGNHNP